MKSLFKLSLSLLANQFLASVGGFMCIIFVWLIAGDSIWSQLIFLLMTFPFFVYIEYRAAYKYGAHDPDRLNKKHSNSYIIKGALSGLISAIPLFILIITFIITETAGNIGISQFAKLYTRIISMYYNWPMCNIFPNHTIAVFLSSMLPVVIIPAVGYIAGYKNFILIDYIYKLFNISPKNK